MKKNKVIFFLFLLAGLGLLNYPFVSQWLNRQNQTKVIYDYRTSAESIVTEEKNEIIALAHQYNEELMKKQTTLSDGFSGELTMDERYNELLNPSGDGVMGWIEIPVIDVMLPVYHTTQSSVLQKGVGHLYQSSLPVGGTDTHAVLSAHTGLATKTLFTDLDQLKKGDRFYLYILDDVLAYEVTEISTVLPEDTKQLGIVPGEDLVTLVTCTPYGINSHRLLVRGSRVAYDAVQQAEPQENIAKEGGIWLWSRRFFILSLFILTCAGVLLLKPEKRGRREDEQ